MTRIRSFALAALAAPLTLAIAACDSTDAADEEALSGEPVAAVEAPAGTNWVDTVQVTDSDGYLLGNPDAPIKLIEYASLTCPACAAFAQNGADQLKEDYVATGKVSYELRNQIHGPHDLILAQMVRCGAPETYHPLSDQVWKNLEEVLNPVFERQEQFGQALSLPEDQRFVQAAGVADFYDFFAARGLSEDQARTCLADFSAMEAIAERPETQSRELDVTGTPSFFLNGRKLELEPTAPWPQIEQRLQQAGAR